MSHTQKFSFQTAKLEIITKTEIVNKQGFLGFNKQVKVETPQVQITKIPGTAEYVTEDLGNGVKLEMVYIRAGSFMMGSNDYDNEKPIHRVNLSPFYMGKYVITQQQYQAIMSENPSHFKGENRPVEGVNWDDAMAFCQQLSRHTKKPYTLPSESQWEYACRAGTTTPFYFGETITTDLVNYNGNYSYRQGSNGKYREQTTDVGTFPPNAFGLYDMHGNVCEWCLDDWHKNYQGAPNNGSAWIANKRSFAILRSGSYETNPVSCRSAVRQSIVSVGSGKGIGFRVVVPPSPGFP